MRIRCRSFLPFVRNPTSIRAGSRPYSFRFEAFSSTTRWMSIAASLDLHRLDELPLAVDLLQPRGLAIAGLDLHFLHIVRGDAGERLVLCLGVVDRFLRIDEVDVGNDADEDDEQRQG